MRSKTCFAVVAIVVALSACGSSGKSTGAPPATPGTVGPRATASEKARSAALVKKALRDFAQGRTGLAKREFKAAVDHNPNNQFGWYNLGVIAQDAKDQAAARANYDRAITLDPKFEQALYNYGLLLFAERDLDQSISYLERVLQVNDKNADAHWNLGLALAQRNNGDADNKRSAAELNKALALNPSLGGAPGAPTSTSTSTTTP